MSRQILESVVDDYGRISVRISDEFTVLTSEEAEAVMAKFNHLQAENAKLRECLQDLAEHIREDDGFGLDYGWMLDRMRELGVEVDDG